MYMIIIIALCVVVPVFILACQHIRRNRDMHRVGAKRIFRIDRVSRYWTAWSRRGSSFYFDPSERRLVYEAISATCGVDLHSHKQVQDWLYSIAETDVELSNEVRSVISAHLKLLLDNERNAHTNDTLSAHVEAYKEIHNNKEGK